MSKSTSRGRPKGQTDAKDRIRSAARAQFLDAGYHAVTMRSIAAAAEVDVALVSYYFGSKQGLFGAAMALPINPAAVLAAELDGDLDTLATRLLAQVLGIWDDPESGQALIATANLAIGDPNVRRLVAEAVSRELVEPIAARLTGDDGPSRAATFCSQISGIIFSRYLLAVQPIATMSAAEIIGHLAPSMQRVIDAGEPTAAV
jgi:AcrR family transcriptional regulator